MTRDDQSTLTDYGEASGNTGRDHPVEDAIEALRADPAVKSDDLDEDMSPRLTRNILRCRKIVAETDAPAEHAGWIRVGPGPDSKLDAETPNAVDPRRTLVYRGPTTPCQVEWSKVESLTSYVKVFPRGPAPDDWRWSKLRICDSGHSRLAGRHNRIARRIGPVLDDALDFMGRNPVEDVNQHPSYLRNDN